MTSDVDRASRLCLGDAPFACLFLFCYAMMSARPPRFLLAVLIVLAGCLGEAPKGHTGASSTAAAATAYVGDEACVSCHEDLYASYHRTGMGRSVMRFDPADAPERFDGTEIHDPKRHLTYTAFVRGDTLYQREFRRDADGEVVYERTHAVEWVIGSGNATRSYMMVVNGIVTEMPLTWYVERKRWDLSPAYEQTNYRFSRPIVLECMTCHNDLPERSPFTPSHYRDVPSGISCERCHGPGGEHVERRLAGFEPDAEQPDPTIISSQRLDRDRQLAVCQQCHLTGIIVYKPEQDPTTYLPGTPLAAHRTVFALQEERDDPERFGIASHAERLALSACYMQSDMTCTTCHDPHRPVEEVGADAFNDVCLSCHASEEGGSPVCSREEEHGVDGMEGACVTCHLQRSGTSDIPHVTFTDHWIRQTLPAPRLPDEVERMRIRPEPFSLVRMTGPPADDAEAWLEEAVATFTLFETRHPLPVYLERVKTLVRRGRAAGGDRAAARLALGRALIEQDSAAVAVPQLAAAAAVFPDDLDVSYWLGVALLRAGRSGDAAARLEYVVEAQPKHVEGWLKLAEAYARTERVAEAENAYRSALDLDPVHHPDGWNNLGMLVLQMRRADEAGPLFERALALNPDMAVALVNLGSVRLVEQDFAAAATLFERVLALEPDNVPALGNLGLVYAQRGRLAEARDLLRRVLTLTPGDQRARAALAQIEQRMQASP